ncbi:MAG: hypothetical protein ABI910_08735 [Gemmatimonadota bacterium]
MSERRWNVLTRVAVGALLAVHALLAWYMRVPGLGTGHDDAWYIALARALRQGSYVELPIVGHPLHAMYPPLYPALLATLGVTDPGHVWMGVLANVALSIAMLVLVAIVAARISPWLAVAVTLVCAVNPMVLYVASGVHSEPMLAGAAALAIAVAASGRRDARALALMGLMAIVAALARSIGLALVVATFALFAFERRWRALAIFSVAASLTVGSWLTWTARAPRLDAGRSYVSDALYAPPETSPAVPTPTSPTPAIDSPRTQVPAESISAAPTSPSLALDSGGALALDSGRAAAAKEEAAAERVAAARAAAGAHLLRTLVDRLTRNVPAYLTRELPTVFAIPTLPGTPVDNAIWLGVFLVTATSGVVVLIKRAWLLTGYLAVSVAILVAWPFEDKRFLAPLVPLFALAMLVGGWWIGGRAFGERGARIVASVLALLLTGAAIRDDAARLVLVAACDRGSATTSPGCFNAEQRDFFAAVAASRRVAADSARFLVSKEATFYLLSDREAVREVEAIASREPAALRVFLSKRRVEYILLSHLHLDQWSLASGLLSECERLELVESFGAHVSLLRVLPVPTVVLDTVPRVAVPEGAAELAPAAADTTGSAPLVGRAACDAIARWNAGTWDEPPVRIW